VQLITVADPWLAQVVRTNHHIVDKIITSSSSSFNHSSIVRDGGCSKVNEKPNIHLDVNTNSRGISADTNQLIQSKAKKTLVHRPNLTKGLAMNVFGGVNVWELEEDVSHDDPYDLIKKTQERLREHTAHRISGPNLSHLDQANTIDADDANVNRDRVSSSHVDDVDNTTDEATMTFLDAIAPAGDAIRVLLVTMAEIRKRDTEEISLGPSIWAKVGKPSARVRSRLLSQIAALPEKLCTLTPRKGKPHLLKIGPDWPRRNQAGNTGL
jgi:hypothetical protein